MIARQLPGRTDNDVKNYWNTKLRKKLAKMGIDPVTHKPIPQVMSEYGNINRLPDSTSLVRSTARSAPRSPSSILPRLPMINHMTRNHNSSQKPNSLAGQPDQNLWPGISAAAWDQLLRQFQENNIDQETMRQPQHFMNEVTSSSSSSSSSTVTTQLLNSSSPGSFGSSQAHIPRPPFTRPDLLPSDPLALGVDLQKQCSSFQSGIFTPGAGHEPPSLTEDQACVGISTLGNGPARDITAYNTGVPPYQAAPGDQLNHLYEAASPGNSFIDSILDRDSQIRPDFPELLDGFFDY
ncbi:hypothetical protein CRG98_031697 [Punica granatum]|nr:hypothetical protein CRG98_031697 [Punica granatum]